MPVACFRCALLRDWTALLVANWTHLRDQLGLCACQSQQQNAREDSVGSSEPKQTGVLLSTPNPSTTLCVLLWNHQALQFDPTHPIELWSNKTITRRSIRYAEGTRRRSAQPSTSAEEAKISAESPETAEGMEQGDPSAYDEEKELQLWLSLDGDADEGEEEESAHQTEKLNLNERQHTPESPFSIADNSGDEEDLGGYELTASAILKGLSRVRSFRFNFLDGDEAKRWC